MPVRQARRAVHQHEVVEIVLGHPPFLARDRLVSMGTLCTATSVTGAASEHPGYPSEASKQKKRSLQFHHMRPQRYNSIQSENSMLKSPCTTAFSSFSPPGPNTRPCNFCMSAIPRGARGSRQGLSDVWDMEPSGRSYFAFASTTRRTMSSRTKGSKGFWRNASRCLPISATALSSEYPLIRMMAAFG